MVEITITNEQKVEATLSPKTSTGQTATLDGGASWSVLSGDGTVVVSDGGLSAFLVSSEVPGDTVYVIEADADLGEGVVTISDTIQLHVEGALAQNLGVTLGTPVSK